VKLPRLRRRQSGLGEYLDNVVCELPLFCWKHRRVAVPTQASANVLVDPCFLAGDLISKSMQVTDLIEQRLKLFVGNRHERPGVRPRRDKSFPCRPSSRNGSRVRSAPTRRGRAPRGVDLERSPSASTASAGTSTYARRLVLGTTRGALVWIARRASVGAGALRNLLG